MEQSVHRPLSQSGLPIVRRVNSAIGERVGLDPLRGTRRPVVTDSSIDPPTRPHPKINALRDRAAAARAGGCGPTLSPPALLPASPIGSRLSLGRIGACPSSAPTPAPIRSRCWAPRADRQAPSPPLPEQLQIALQGLRTLLEVSAGFAQSRLLVCQALQSGLGSR